MKQNVLGLKRPQRERYLFSFSEDHNPGVVIDITLQEPDFPTIIKIGKICSEFAQRYLVPIGDELPPFPLVDGEQVELSEELINLACTIYGLQAGKLEDIYEVEDIINLLHTMPVGMAKVSGKAQELGDKFMGLLENPTQAVIIPLSEYTSQPSDDTLN